MLKGMKREEVMIACREHCRMIAELWDLMSDKDKADYAGWHAVHIRDLGLEAKLIDILASPECLKIPLRCTGCPVCQEESSDRFVRGTIQRVESEDFSRTL
jgi:hypothetical protein